MRRAAVVLLVCGWLVGGAGGVAAADEGPWTWPLLGQREVSRGFDPPATRYGAGHRGVDLPAAPGAAVRAAGGGTVTYAGLLAGRGVVVVAHGALRTTYEPVTAELPVGTAVAVGDVLGWLEPGHLGCAAAACLHWGLRRGEHYLDPVRLLEGGPVRLLPVEPGPAAGLGPVEPGPRLPVGTSGPAQRAVPGQPEPDLAPIAAPLDEPRWSVRARELPLGGAALLALAAGIALLRRPGGPPAVGPGGGAAHPPVPAALEEPAPEPPAQQLLDLDAARLLRRRAG